VSLKEFIKIAVGLREHPKVLEAGDDAGWLFTCSLMWSKEHDTDGLIPHYAVARLNGYSGRRLSRAVQACVTSRLWEEHPEGFRVHDYLEHQESSERRKNAAKVAAKARWDAEKAMRSASEPHPDRNANGTGTALRNGNAEEEEEEEKRTPPLPPASGGSRKRDLDRYENALQAWATDHVPEADPRLVAGAVKNLRAANCPEHEITPDRIRDRIRRTFPHLGGAA
jgi:hypothetical protein